MSENDSKINRVLLWMVSSLPGADTGNGLRRQAGC